MGPLTKEEMVEEVGEDLSLYLKQGEKKATPEIAETLFEGIEIKDSEKLANIHFLVNPRENKNTNVIQFIRKLPQRVRNIKTVNKKERTTYKGEVRGRIDWNRTIKKRYSQQPGDKSIFVCSSPTKEYNIDENLVLKKLLYKIYEVLSYKEWEKAMEKEYKWIKEWIGKEGEKGIRLVEELKKIFRRNVHIKRIKDAEEYEVTDKMIQKTKKSRSKLYREAAYLLEFHNQLMKEGVKGEGIKEVLNGIEPPKSTLFELYGTFKIINQMKEGVSLKPLSAIGDNQVAEIEKENKIIKIFHDSIGDLKFQVRKSEVESAEASGIMKKYKENKLSLNKIENKLEDKESNMIYSGRPDIVIEEFEKNSKNKKPERVYIGEVKCTSKKKTALTGLKELLEYMKTYEYLEKQEEPNMHGLLLINGWPFEKNPPFQTEDENISILENESIKKLNK